MLDAHSVAKLKLECLSLGYRIDKDASANVERAKVLFAWVTQPEGETLPEPSGQPETAPRRGRKPKHTTETK